jgi:hypothetical protein
VTLSPAAQKEGGFYKFKNKDKGEQPARRLRYQPLIIALTFDRVCGAC